MLYEVVKEEVVVTLCEDEVVIEEVAVEVGEVDEEVVVEEMDVVLAVDVETMLLLVLVVVLTVETLLRVARNAPPAMIKIMTTTTTIRMARETAPRLNSLECNFLLRLEYRYLCIATISALTFRFRNFCDFRRSLIKSIGGLFLKR